MVVLLRISCQMSEILKRLKTLYLMTFKRKNIFLSSLYKTLANCIFRVAKRSRNVATNLFFHPSQQKIRKI